MSLCSNEIPGVLGLRLKEIAFYDSIRIFNALWQEHIHYYSQSPSLSHEYLKLFSEYFRSLTSLVSQTQDHQMSLGNYPVFPSTYVKSLKRTNDKNTLPHSFDTLLFS